ncbi:hypothetical protein CZ787_03095 [Halomonas citrativorans]|uniref:Uncharacterized protein n=1 Tax=Halomonas citrativorans TaxID=2742612 RepID=A0A1R4HRR7_9GAMM|nr:hypothetical protein [Halomonas citrativorans]SJN10196.1 hypothetical protein CZ787_03095 [Halomonas citrativorans]
MGTHANTTWLLKEGKRLAAEIKALDGKPDAGPKLLVLYMQLQDVVQRAAAELPKEAA